VKLTAWSRILLGYIICYATAGTLLAGVPVVGDPVPEWRLSGVEGATWSSDDLSGKVVVLEFWATWCPRCRANMPEVARLTRDYADRPVQVIAVNILEDGDPVAYMKEKGSEIAFALNGDEVAKRLGVAGTPTVVVIDTDGRLALRLSGAGDARTEQLRSSLDALLARGR
jgi:thiol-disulfide isomerase/thioredoxin